jgi:hypothetical protein
MASPQIFGALDNGAEAGWADVESGYGDTLYP